MSEGERPANERAARPHARRGGCQHLCPTECPYPSAALEAEPGDELDLVVLVLAALRAARQSDATKPRGRAPFVRKPSESSAVRPVRTVVAGCRRLAQPILEARPRRSATSAQAAIHSHLRITLRWAARVSGPLDCVVSCRYRVSHRHSMQGSYRPASLATTGAKVSM
jgi:hypothetical protein